MWVRAANVQAGVLTVVLVLVGWMLGGRDGWLFWATELRRRMMLDSSGFQPFVLRDGHHGASPHAGIDRAFGAEDSANSLTSYTE
jgi:hypothetical protein